MNCKKKEYNKYKNKYIKLKRERLVKEYIFKHFDDIQEQKKFMEDKFEWIISMLSQCFPHELDKMKTQDEFLERKINIYNEMMRRMLRYNMNKRWFFVLWQGNIIAVCYIQDRDTFIKSDLELKTYRKMSFSREDLKKTKITMKGPVLFTLCKDKNFPKAGSFLLEKVSDLLMQENYTEVYLVSGSEYYRNNYLYFINLNACEFIDPEKYHSNNMKLIEYYERNNFQIVDKLYLIEKCINNDQNNEYLFYNVLVRKFTQI